MSTPPSTVTIPISLPVGPNSRIGEIIAAAMNRHAKTDKTASLMTDTDKVETLRTLVGKNIDQIDTGAGINVSVKSGLPPEVRAGIAISFVYSLSVLVQGGKISRATFRDLNHDFQSLLLACDPEIMLGDAEKKQDSTFNRMSHAFFLDLGDLKQGKTE